MATLLNGRKMWAGAALIALGQWGCGSDSERPESATLSGPSRLQPSPSGAATAETTPGGEAAAENASPASGAAGETREGNPGPGTALEQPAAVPASEPSSTPPAAIDPGSLRVVEYPIPGNLPGCSPAYPHDPAVDEATGLVYYAGSNESCIGQFNPETGAFQAWPTATPDAYPHGLVVLNGVVYFTGIDANVIGSVDPATGQAVDYPVAASGPHTPVLLDGSIWFTAQRGGQYGRLNPETGQAEVFAFSAANTGPYGIWPAPDGSLWVALYSTNRLARIDTAAMPTTHEEFVLSEPGARPRRLAVDAQGRVWFTDYAQRRLGRFDLRLPEAERTTEFPTPGGGSPYGIAIGPDGRVWYNDQDSAEIVGFDQESESVVARLPLELDNPGPVRNITVDQPRRRLWLAISNVGRLAMIQF